MKSFYSSRLYCLQQQHQEIKQASTQQNSFYKHRLANYKQQIESWQKKYYLLKQIDELKKEQNIVLKAQNQKLSLQIKQTIQRFNFERSNPSNNYEIYQKEAQKTDILLLKRQKMQVTQSLTHYKKSLKDCHAKIQNLQSTIKIQQKQIKILKQNLQKVVSEINYDLIPIEKSTQRN